MEEAKRNAMKIVKRDTMKTIIQGIIVTMIFFIAFLLFELFLAINPRFVVFINNGIYLPKPETMTTIYRFNFKEGDDLNIWSYSEKRFNKLTSKGYLHKINDNNIEVIRKRVGDYYNGLTETEKKLFNENVNIDEIIIVNNYYFYKQSKEDDQTFLTIIADCSSKNLYFFDRVR